MKKILILGSTGMLGHMVYHYLSTISNYKIFSSPYKLRINSTKDLILLESFINDIHPDIVINCIGLLVNDSEQYLDNAILVNGVLPNVLSYLSYHNGFKLINYSTDCVFSGMSGGYTEKDYRDGMGEYSITKKQGELDNNRDLTFRTSIIGPEISTNRSGLFNWVFNSKGTIQGFSEVMWNGVTTLELAKATEQAIRDNLIGVYHLVPTVNISKYYLILLIVSIWRLNIVVDVNDTIKSDKTLINTRKDFCYTVPYYIEMLKDLHFWMSNHKELYNDL